MQIGWPWLNPQCRTTQSCISLSPYHYAQEITQWVGKYMYSVCGSLLPMFKTNSLSFVGNSAGPAKAKCPNVPLKLNLSKNLTTLSMSSNSAFCSLYLLSSLWLSCRSSTLLVISAAQCAQGVLEFCLVMVFFQRTSVLLPLGPTSQVRLLNLSLCGVKLQVILVLLLQNWVHSCWC